MRLVQRLKEGDPEALGHVFETHIDEVFRYACRMLGNRHDAEDVAADVFIKARDRVQTLIHEKALKSWLFTITRNLCLDRMRQRSFISTEDAEPECQDDPVFRVTVRSAVEALPPMYRDVVILDMEDLSANEGAGVLGITVSAYKSALYRARSMLRCSLYTTFGEIS